jgi:hypothetical protein
MLTLNWSADDAAAARIDCSTGYLAVNFVAMFGLNSISVTDVSGPGKLLVGESHTVHHHIQSQLLLALLRILPRIESSLTFPPIGLRRSKGGRKRQITNPADGGSYWSYGFVVAHY